MSSYRVRMETTFPSLRWDEIPTSTTWNSWDADRPTSPTWDSILAPAWDVTDDDPPGYGLTDPLIIGWSTPTRTPGVPEQPDPMAARFGFVWPTASANPVNVGDMVTFYLWFGTKSATPDQSDPDIVFFGVVTDADANPHPRGVFYQFTAVDFTGLLNGYTVHAADRPAETVRTRMDAYMLETTAQRGPTAVTRHPFADQAQNTNRPLAAEKASPAGAGDAIIDLWAGVAMSTTNPTVWYRPILSPGPPVAGEYPTTPNRWGLALDLVPADFLPDVAGAGAVPGILTETSPNHWQIVISIGDREAGVLDACFIDFDATWTAGRFQVVDTAVVTWTRLDTVGSPPADVESVVTVTVVEDVPGSPNTTPAVTVRADSGLTARTTVTADTDAAAANATGLGHILVPAGRAKTWTPDTFAWLLYADTIGLNNFPPIFPRHDIPVTAATNTAWKRVACYMNPVTVMNLPAAWNITDPTIDYLTGQLQAAELTIQDGKPTVAMTIAPHLPAGTGIAWDAMNTGAAWDEMDPTITWDQMHLVRA